MNDKKLIRLHFRRGVFERDQHKCKVCGAPGIDRQWHDGHIRPDLPSLDAHHITDRHDFKNGGYVLSNGITLCDKCHILAESGAKGLTRPELYVKIGSSFNKARLEDFNAR